MKNNQLVKKIFEDNDILVLDKQPNTVVNRAETVKEATLQDWFETTYPQIIQLYNQVKTHPDAKIFLERSGMVHRLDKDTSGVMLWAKNPESMLNLMDQFKNRDIQKTYIALVHGQFKNRDGYIKVPLGRSRGNRQKFGVQIEGKMSETKYQVLESYNGDQSMYSDGFSLVQLWPKTGRTHQIRVVLKHLQKPIVGDFLYVGRKRSKYDANWANRQFLHAAEIEFTHPQTNQIMEFKAELSDDLKSILNHLRAKYQLVI